MIRADIPEFYVLSFGFGVITKNVTTVTAVNADCSSFGGTAYSRSSESGGLAVKCWIA